MSAVENLVAPAWEVVVVLLDAFPAQAPTALEVPLLADVVLVVLAAPAAQLALVALVVEVDLVKTEFLTVPVALEILAAPDSLVVLVALNLKMGVEPEISCLNESALLSLAEVLRLKQVGQLWRAVVFPLFVIRGVSEKMSGIAFCLENADHEKRNGDYGDVEDGFGFAFAMKCFWSFGFDFGF